METLTNTNTPVHTARTEILSRSSSSEAKSVKTHPRAAGSPRDGDSPRSPAWPGCPHGFLAPLARCWAELGWKVPEDPNPGEGSGTRVPQLPHCRQRELRWGTPTRQRCRALPSQAITFVLPSCSSPHISAGFRSSGCDLPPGRADVPERGPRGGCGMSPRGAGAWGWGRSKQSPLGKPAFISLQNLGKIKSTRLIFHSRRQEEGSSAQSLHSIIRPVHPCYLARLVIYLRGGSGRDN